MISDTTIWLEENLGNLTSFKHPETHTQGLGCAIEAIGESSPVERAELVFGLDRGILACVGQVQDLTVSALTTKEFGGDIEDEMRQHRLHVQRLGPAVGANRHLHPIVVGVELEHG